MMRIWMTMLSIAAVWLTGLVVNRRFVRRCDGKGDPRQGILIFVEPVRWLFLIWGFSSFCRGLRRAGWGGQTRLFRWSTVAGSLLVVPDAVRQPWLMKRARRLARRINELAAEYPDIPIHLCGYSTGCFIVLEALQTLPPGRIQNAILLAGTISPHYPIDSLEKTGVAIHHVYSPVDLINLLGPMLIGTNDRRWGPACGSQGFATSPAGLIERRWRLRDLTRFYFGDHFSIVSASFVSQNLAPLLWKAAGIRTIALQETPS